MYSNAAHVEEALQRTINDLKDPDPTKLINTLHHTNKIGMSSINNLGTIKDHAKQTSDLWIKQREQFKGFRSEVQRNQDKCMSYVNEQVKFMKERPGWESKAMGTNKRDEHYFEDPVSDKWYV